MMTKITGLTNGYFCVRQNDKKDVLIASLINAVIPADAWNELRDKVCNDTKISDDTTCYVTVGDWRKLGFSGNNIKNCIPSAPKEVIEEANKFFYYNNEILKLGILCGRKLERVQQMIFKQIFATEMRTLAENYRKNFKEVGMTDEDVDNWFEQTIHDVYHPKC